MNGRLKGREASLLVLRTARMGGSQGSDHTGNTAGRCDSVEEDPLLLGMKGKSC